MTQAAELGRRFDVSIELWERLTVAMKERVVEIVRTHASIENTEVTFDDCVDSVLLVLGYFYQATREETTLLVSVLWDMYDILRKQ